MTYNTTPYDSQAHSKAIDQEVMRTRINIQFALDEIIIHKNQVMHIESSGKNRIQQRTAIASPNYGLAIQLKAPFFSALKYSTEHLNKSKGKS